MEALALTIKRDGKIISEEIYRTMTTDELHRVANDQCRAHYANDPACYTYGIDRVSIVRL